MTKRRFNLRTVAAIIACLAVTSLVFFGCTKDDDKQNNGSSSITIANEKDLTQTAGANDETTGNGFTFTAKGDWTASVKEVETVKSSGVSWIKLLCNGKETYSGNAGTFTIVISIERNETGKKRAATIEIKSGSDKITISVTQEGEEVPSGEPIELKSPITVNTTLKDLGLPVDYIFTANSQLSVENNATLTIEPGVTIQFTHANRGGSIAIKAGSTIKAIGTASKRIQFIGANNEKGSWNGIQVLSNTDNRFEYCDFINVGSVYGTTSGGMRLSDAKAGFSHCKISGGLGYGIHISSSSIADCQLTAFSNNVIEGFDNYPPVFIYSSGGLKLLEKFDMTTDMTKNAHQYIEIRPDMMNAVTINETTVPYYIRNTFWISHPLIINEGVTIYLDAGVQGVQKSSSALLTINGTASKKVKFTRLPGSTQYWGNITFNNRLTGCVINHCIFEYGGATSSADDAIICITSPTELTLNNVEIRNAQDYGAQIKGCDYVLKHSNVTFSNNRLGNVADRCSTPPVIRDHFPDR